MSAVATATTVVDVLTKAHDGERLADDDALTLLRSRDLFAVARAANEIRNRKHDPRRVF